MFIVAANNTSSVIFVSSCVFIAGEGMSRQCYFGQFKCANHGCIGAFRLCDGTNDCDDGSDEIGCGLYIICHCSDVHTTCYLLFYLLTYLLTFCFILELVIVQACHCTASSLEFCHQSADSLILIIIIIIIIIM